ncbi:unnamed protein product [Polarella glacialis]|uniref:Uncharacterized protein n=1 Tax=Polarella glacialis TaxID=89957 RepID=A0A813F8U7_POLGL|nr:unnamed protein product [Polarella glacialis]CAE8679762.1 unnamed protein product [Polarella glacialis]
MLSWGESGGTWSRHRVVAQWWQESSPWSYSDWDEGNSWQHNGGSGSSWTSGQSSSSSGWAELDQSQNRGLEVAHLRTRGGGSADHSGFNPQLLRERHLVMILAVKQMFSTMSRGLNMPLAALHTTWQFLREPFELVVVLDTPSGDEASPLSPSCTSFATSLQTGRSSSERRLCMSPDGHAIPINALQDFADPRVCQRWAGSLHETLVENSAVLTAFPVYPPQDEIPECHRLMWKRAKQGMSSASQREGTADTDLHKELSLARCSTVIGSDVVLVREKKRDLDAFSIEFSAVSDGGWWAFVAFDEHDDSLHVNIFDTSSGEKLSDFPILSGLTIEELFYDMFGFMILAHGSMLIVILVVLSRSVQFQTTVRVYQPLGPRIGKVGHEEAWSMRRQGELSAETFLSNFLDLDVQENKLAIIWEHAVRRLKLFCVTPACGLAKVPYRTIHSPSRATAFVRVTLATAVVVTQRVWLSRSGEYVASEANSIIEVWPADPGFEGDPLCLHRIALPSAVEVRHIFCQPVDSEVRLDVLEQVLFGGEGHLAEPDIPAGIPEDPA